MGTKEGDAFLLNGKLYENATQADIAAYHMSIEDIIEPIQGIKISDYYKQIIDSWDGTRCKHCHGALFWESIAGMWLHTFGRWPDGANGIHDNGYYCTPDMNTSASAE